MDGIFKKSGISNGEADVEYTGYAVTPDNAFANYQAQLPWQNGKPVVCQGIYVKTGGTIAVVLNAAGDTAALTVASATLVVIDHIHIKATGTTASGLFALTR